MTTEEIIQPSPEIVQQVVDREIRLVLGDLVMQGIFARAQVEALQRQLAEAKPKPNGREPPEEKVSP